MRAVFLDKDGTLVQDVPYNVDVALVRLAPGAAAALGAMRHAGYKLIVVSNQSGVARGYFPEAALGPVEARVRSLLGEEGICLDGFYYCPHHPKGLIARYARACGCRKPEPGLIVAAAARHGIDLASSWVVGDILDDVEAGRRAGARTVLIDNGNETEWMLGAHRKPHFMVPDLPRAAAVIQATTLQELA